jgi:hypothetical protein
MSDRKGHVGGDHEPSYTELQQLKAEAQRLHNEAAEYHAAAEKKLADANYTLGQSEHRLRTAEDNERSIAERERWLEQHGEADLVARARALAEREAAAAARDAEWDQAKFEALRKLTA